MKTGSRSLKKLNEVEFVKWLKESVFKNLDNFESVLGVSKKTIRRWLNNGGMSKPSKLQLSQLKEVFLILKKSLSIKQIDDWLWGFHGKDNLAQPIGLMSKKHYDYKKLKEMADAAKDEYK